MFCDLHCHSTASDGTVPPKQLPDLAKAVGLAALALTDHDTTAGIPLCAERCAEVGVEFVPGIEVSAEPKHLAAWASGQRGTLHILGLFVRHDDSRLIAIHDRMKAARDGRNPAIVKKLNQVGVDIHYDEVDALARQQGTEIIGRPHIAQVMMAHGYVASVRDAFKQYMGSGGPAYVPRDRVEPDQAIEAIHHAGGLAVLAHPVQLGFKSIEQLRPAVEELQALGLDGVEVWHSDHSPEQVELYAGLAMELNLLPSGGSDFHGQRKEVELGSQKVPIEVYERLREVCGS